MKAGAANADTMLGRRCVSDPSPWLPSPLLRRPLMTSEELLPTAVPSETELLRQQLLRAQRLSSVGTLASSVAHEFNNILTTIINYAKLGMKPDCSDASKQQAL